MAGRSVNKKRHAKQLAAAKRRRHHSVRAERHGWMLKERLARYAAAKLRDPKGVAEYERKAARERGQA